MTQTTNTDFSVTLQALRKAKTCYSGYNKVVRSLQGKPFTAEDEERESYLRFRYPDPIPLTSILASNGLDDALWATRCLVGKDRDLRMFAVWAVRQVQDLLTDPRSLRALDVAEAYAEGRATEDELAVAHGEAWAAARAAAYAAYYAAPGDASYAAARAAAYAARAAPGDAAYAAQSDMFIKMCQGQAPWQAL